MKKLIFLLTISLFYFLLSGNFSSAKAVNFFNFKVMRKFILFLVITNVICLLSLIHLREVSAQFQKTHQTSQNQKPNLLAYSPDQYISGYLSGPTHGVVGQTLVYTAGFQSVRSYITDGTIFWKSTTNSRFSGLSGVLTYNQVSDKPTTLTISASWIPSAPGDYYIFIGASGNPSSASCNNDPLPENLVPHCGPEGLIKVTITANAPPPPGGGACWTPSWKGGSMNNLLEGTNVTLQPGAAFTMTCNYGSHSSCIYPSGVSTCNWQGTNADGAERFGCNAPTTPGSYPISCTVGACACNYPNPADNHQIGVLTVSAPPPPTASITGPTSLTVGQSGTFSASANQSSDSTLSKGQMHFASTTADLSQAGSWTQIGTDQALSGQTGSFSKSYTWNTAGTYYVTVDIYNANGGKCTGNPTLTGDWVSCGTNDYLTVTVYNPKTPPCYIPASLGVGTGGYGDVNQDGKVSTIDSDLITKYLIGLTTFTSAQIEAADVNGTANVLSSASNISSSDALIILNFLNGSISTFTACPTPTPGPSCPLKNRGDANCDGKINILDFNIWRDEFLRVANTTSADFNSDNSITILDFNVWRDGFLDPSLPH